MLSLKLFRQFNVSIHILFKLYPTNKFIIFNKKNRLSCLHLTLTVSILFPMRPVALNRLTHFDSALNDIGRWAANI